jgi:hypothetical protein
MATRIVSVKAPKLEGLTHYFRAGIKLSRGGENVIEVSEEQLAILRADPALLVAAVDDKPAKVEPKK